MTQRADESDEDYRQRVTAWAQYLGAHPQSWAAATGHEAFMAGWQAAREHCPAQP